MTFADLKTEIKDRLGYTSTTADTRVGRLLNKIYREIGTSIGLDFSRQTNTSEVVTVGNANVTFSETEKILQVWRLDGSGNPVVLDQVLLAELRDAVIPKNDKPTAWALVSTTSNGVTVRLSAEPATAYTLHADVIAEVSDLSGTMEPAFPESFHDILIEGVLKDEYRKLEKVQLARDSEATFQRRLSDLRMFVAKSAYLDIQQGKVQDIKAGTSGGGQASLGSTVLTITALWTFDRDPSAPFAVSASSAVVPNLDADKLDGFEAVDLVRGPATSTDNALVRWDGVAGEIVQDSFATLTDGAGPTLSVAAGTVNAGLHQFNPSRGFIRAGANGVFEFSGNSGGDFGRVQFGGTTASFSAIKSNGLTVAIRLADDSADSDLTAKNVTASGTVAATGNVTASGNMSATGTLSYGGAVLPENSDLIVALEVFS